MRRLDIFGIVIFIFFGFDVLAETNSYQSLGISLSSFSGSGLSYRYHFDNRWGLQLTGGAIISDDGKSAATGLEIQSDLSTMKDKRMYLLMALGWYVESEDVFTKSGELFITKNVDINYYKLAIGFGGELAFGNSFVEHLSLGIAIYPIGISIKEKHSYPEYDDTSKINFGASLFTHFNF